MDVTQLLLEIGGVLFALGVLGRLADRIGFSPIPFYLLAGLGDLQLSVLAAVRAESLQGAHPLRRVLTELRRLRTVRVLDLAPLGRADTETLAAAVVGRTLAADAAEQVWQRSGGNPFVIEELARDLRDGRDGLSETLREIFLDRVDALPQHAHAVVHAVAAGVEPVQHWLLAEVLRCFEERTGLPVLVNTSLNTAGRPIVDSPTDVLELFGSAPVDVLVMGPFLVRRADLEPA